MNSIKKVLITVFRLILFIGGLVLAASDNLYIAALGFFILIMVISFGYKIIKKQKHNQE